MHKTIGLGVALVAGLIFAATVSATVGGPTLVYNLRFDTKTDAVYFTEYSETGRGCLPELKKLSLATGVSETIYPCDGEVFDATKREAEISAYTDGMNYLSSINLKKNGIEVALEVGEEEYLEPGWLLKTKMTAHVYQNGTKKLSFPLSACNAEQPFVIDGYFAPTHADKLVLLVSGKNDCFEGGYTLESLKIVPNVTLVDDATLNVYKRPSALAPHEGSLVVYPGQTVAEKPEVVETEEDPNLLTLSVIGLIGLLLGVCLGRVGKKS